MIKFKTYACKFDTLNDFETESNRLGRQGWQLFSFCIAESEYIAVWHAAYQDSIDSYGQYEARQAII